MSNPYDALIGALSQAIDIIKNLPDYEKKGSEGKREPQGGLGGIRRDKGSEGLTDDPEILNNSVFKRYVHGKNEKSTKINASEPPKIPCPYANDAEKKFKCKNPSCKFGEFWAVYVSFKSSNKWRAHGSFRITWRCASLASKIIDDVVTRKLMHAPWQVEKKYRPHATTYLNNRGWEEPIEGEQHERSPYQSIKSSAKVFTIESIADKARRQREAFRAAENNE
jgi:hypothetical protein